MNGALPGEGNSDRALLPLLLWVLREATPVDTSVEWVDTSRLPPARSLADKVAQLRKVQPCELLFVHRDSDKQRPEWRYREVTEAAGDQLHVAVVPVRTMEAWLLPHEAAIRAAAGRVSGKDALGLPNPARIEDIADPKRVLRDALVQAHGATGRRKDRFDPAAALYRLADLVEDWSVLRQLPAFRRLEADTRAALSILGVPVHAGR